MSADHPLPPLFGVAPPLQCNRLFSKEDGSYCGKPAEFHIMWTSDMDNGLACREHMDEVRRRWVFFAAHPYEMACSMPGAVFLADENRCVVDEEGLGLSATAEEPLPAVKVEALTNG